jgi:hypothetical protein
LTGGSRESQLDSVTSAEMLHDVADDDEAVRLSAIDLIANTRGNTHDGHLLLREECNTLLSPTPGGETHDGFDTARGRGDDRPVMRLRDDRKSASLKPGQPPDEGHSNGIGHCCHLRPDIGATSRSLFSRLTMPSSQ